MCLFWEPTTWHASSLFPLFCVKNRWFYLLNWALRSSRRCCRARCSPSAPPPALQHRSFCAPCSCVEQRQCPSRCRWDKCGTPCPQQLCLEETCAFVLDEGREPHKLSWLVPSCNAPYFCDIKNVAGACMGSFHRFLLLCDKRICQHCKCKCSYHCLPLWGSKLQSETCLNSFSLLQPVTSCCNGVWLHPFVSNAVQLISVILQRQMSLPLKFNTYNTSHLMDYTAT